MRRTEEIEPQGPERLSSLSRCTLSPSLMLATHLLLDEPTKGIQKRENPYGSSAGPSAK